MNGLMPLTTTSTELQRHYKRVVRLAKRTKQPITVLSQNKPTLLVMDPTAYHVPNIPSALTNTPYGVFAEHSDQFDDVDQEIHRLWDDAMKKVERQINT